MTSPLNLSPVMADRDVAIEWFQTYTVVGVEGLVVKAGVQPYTAGQRGWDKVLSRLATEVRTGALLEQRSRHVEAREPSRFIREVFRLVLPLADNFRAYLQPSISLSRCVSRCDYSRFGQFVTIADFVRGNYACQRRWARLQRKQR